MNAEDIEEFTGFLENLIRDYREEGIEIIPFTSNSLANQIREKYSVQKRDYQESYVLVEEEQAAPCCKGCPNELGPCGTPCNDCEKWETWRKEWMWEMYVPNKFSIWRRKQS